MSAARHDLRIGPWMPVWVLGAVMVLVGVGTALVLGGPLFWVGMVAAATIIGVVVPRLLTAWGAAALVGLTLLFGPVDGARTALAVFGVHLLVVLASLVLPFPLGGRIALSALRASGVRFLTIQVPAQLLGLLATLIAGSAGGVSFGWLAPAGAAVVVALVLLTVRVAGRR
ncbi:hypothetical protein [Microbacterium gorillae]|uniref:hypothetical protein n=1 Tax=Microbacterium gorillae TaxID=1231063 RepID=UPI00058AE046|nr:hypothetical protein [Microbacterium gorillae]